MTAEHLSKRDAAWVGQARVIGDKGESDFIAHLATHLPGYYEIDPKPDKIKLFGEERGIFLDAEIINTLTGEILFVEKKTGNRGGNAHERGYKFTNPNLQRCVSEMYNTVPNPFFLVFSGKTFASAEPFSYQTRAGKTVKVNPQRYRDEINLLLEGQQYAIIEEGFKNMDIIADQIMAII